MNRKMAQTSERDKREDISDSPVLQVAEKSMLPGFNLTPKTLAEALEFAKLMAESDLVPKDYRGKPGNVFIAVQMGAEIGLSPMASIQNIAPINGKPCIYGDVGKALLLDRGCLIEETDIEEIRKTGIARCTISRPGRVPVTRTFSLDDAKQAKLLGKEGPWTQYRERMMAWRAFWFAARDGAADILKGLGGGEELEDLLHEPRNITPVKMPQSRSEAGAAGVGASAGSEQEATREPGSDDKLRFEIAGRHYETDGITREQMLESFRLAPLVDANCGKNHAAKILINEFKLGSRNELTAETGAKYIARLRFDAGEKIDESASG